MLNIIHLLCAQYCATPNIASFRRAQRLLPKQVRPCRETEIAKCIKKLQLVVRSDGLVGELHKCGESGVV